MTGYCDDCGNTMCVCPPDVIAYAVATQRVIAAARAWAAWRRQPELGQMYATSYVTVADELDAAVADLEALAAA